MAAAAIVCGAMFYTSCSNKVDTVKQEPITQGNPYLPLWEHIPDGEPYVFEDPDNPGKQRVYIYGSHDNLKTMYCGRDQVVWSAPVEDLTQWRYDGEILVVNKNAKGEPFDSAGTADVLYAPDVTLVTDSTGKKTYYLFPNDQTGFRNGLIAKSDSPKGSFEVCNWNADDPNKVDGIYGFDPAVFVDDDGRIYGYWGFEHSMAAEIDPATMGTVKPGTEVVDGMVSGRNEPGVFRFFEASSLRKIKDKYVFIYSRFTEDGEFGLPTSNYTLAYAYSDKPLGPWIYGGTIIDGRAREKDEQGNVIASAVPTAIPTARFVKSTASGMSSTTVRLVPTNMPVRQWWLLSPLKWKKVLAVRWKSVRVNTIPRVLPSMASIPSSVIRQASPVG